MGFDILAVGDTVVDTFIRLKDAEQLMDHGVRELCVRYGDKVPFEFSETVPAVGNSANAAVSSARLGLNTAFVSTLGKDLAGESCLKQFTNEGVSTDHIHINDKGETTQNFILWYGVERTILVRYANYQYELPKPLPETRAVYLSGIGEANAALYDGVADWLESNPDIFFALQPGTFEIKAGITKLERLYKRANVVISNKEEFQRILESKETDPKKLLEAMRSHGPKIAILTDGREGSYVLSDEGAWHAPMYPDPEPPKERTGAGDATSSTTVAYILKGLPPQEALLRGHINSAYVVQEIGAQKGLRTHEQIDELYEKRPADFKATEF